MCLASRKINKKGLFPFFRLPKKKKKKKKKVIFNVTWGMFNGNPILEWVDIYCYMLIFTAKCWYLLLHVVFTSYINVQTGEVKIEKYKNQESATVLQIKILGGDNGVEDLQKVCIVLRIQVSTNSNKWKKGGGRGGARKGDWGSYHFQQLWR